MDVLRMVFGGARALANLAADQADDPRIEASARAAGVVVGLVGRLVEREPIEEVQRQLAEMVARQSRPVTQEDLDAQRAAVLAEFGVT